MMMRTSSVGRAALVLALTGMLACGSKSADSTSTSTTSAPSGKPASSAKPAESAKARASSQPAPAGSTEPQTEGAGMTAVEFCDAIAKMGAANLAKCTKDDENTVQYLEFSKDVTSASADCTKALQSANVEFHGDVAAKCLAAAREIGGGTTYTSTQTMPECAGIVTGKVAEGQAAARAFECAAGLALLRGKCVKPGAKMSECELTAGFSKPGDHAPCATGLVCSAQGSDTDGDPGNWRCVEPRPLDGPCNALMGDCPTDSSCYQGKCRTRGAPGDQCVNHLDCKLPTICHVAGGTFGKCVAPFAAGEGCSRGSECASTECRGNKCMSFCGSR